MHADAACAVLSCSDPSVNVVLLEDAMDLAGLLVAADCITITHLTGSHYADCIGYVVLCAAFTPRVCSASYYVNVLVL